VALAAQFRADDIVLNMPPLLVASLVVLLEGLSLSALFPVLHKYTAQLGHFPTSSDAAAWIGVMFALVAGPKVVMNPTWGWCSDRVGRRPILLLITLGTLLGSVGWALAPSLRWLALTRVWVGLFGAQATLASAVAADVSTPQRRAASMAALGAAFGVAFTLGPLGGGLVGARWGYAAVGWLCASFQTVSLLLVLVALRETRRPAPGGVDLRSALRGPLQLVRARGVAPLLAVTFLMTVATAELIASFGVFSEQVYHYSARQTAYAFAFFGFVSALMQGGVRPMVARVGERRLGSAALVLMGVALASIALRPRPALLWMALAAAAAGGSIATSCLTALLSHAVGATEQGSVLGLQQSTIGLARAVGFMLGGALYAALSAAGPYGLGALLSLGGGWWLLFLRVRTAQDAIQPAPASAPD